MFGHQRWATSTTRRLLPSALSSTNVRIGRRARTPSPTSVYPSKLPTHLSWRNVRQPVKVTLPLDGIRRQLAGSKTPYGILGTEQEVAGFVGDAPLLTDDYAPVDQLLSPYGYS